MTRMDREMEAALAWTFPQGAGGALSEALGSQDREGNHQSRHAKFSSERGLLCWDVQSQTVVEVSDWMRDEYWGERVLDVWERLASRARGLHWERRQSDLVELAPDLQGLWGKTALHQMSGEEAEEVAAKLARAWLSKVEARALDEASKPAGQESNKPRL